MTDKREADGEGAVAGQVLATIRSPIAMASLPLIMVAAHWIAGETGLTIAAIVLPGLVIAVNLAPKGEVEQTVPVDGLTGMALRTQLVQALDKVLIARSTSGMSTACLVVDVDNFKEIVDRHGHGASDTIIMAVADCLRDVMRGADLIARLDGATFAIMLSPVRNADLESVIQISSRIQSAVGEPIAIGDLSLYLSCSIGFCLTSRTPEENGGKMLLAAESAMIEARRNGPGAIRSYSKEMKLRLAAQASLIDDAHTALDLGQVAAWFQPQVSTETGAITGFEALARWSHPERGLIPPAEFLPAFEEAGLLPRLGEVMLSHALTALRNWDSAGLTVPSVAVNFSEAELRDPRLMEKIKWELDRFNLTPQRLTVEILEHVVAGADDEAIARNIQMLSDLGCGIDLDDFGTGTAAIASIRRFAIGRIKIDRSFVTKIDEDPDQQRMLSAILMMAERLELEALAEGVESLGEQSVLAQLGCQHVQGFGIARPMPFDDTLIWIARHAERLKDTPSAALGGKTGSKRA